VNEERSSSRVELARAASGAEVLCTIRALGAVAAAVAAGLKFRQRRRRRAVKSKGGGDVGRLAPSSVRRGGARGPARLRLALVVVFLGLTSHGLRGAWKRRARRAAKAAASAASARSPADGIWDAVVAGAGPAGLSAALFCARAGLSVIVLGSDAGLLAEAPRLANFPGRRSGRGGGGSWLADARAQASAAGAAFAPGARAAGARAVGARGGYFEVALEGGEAAVRGRSVIAASGATPRRLGLAGEDALWGTSVHSCALCDGALYAGADVLVVGGGDGAYEAAALLARIARSVTLVHRGLRATDAALVAAVGALPSVEVLAPYQVVGWRVERGALAGADLARVVGGGGGATRRVACAGAFVLIGATPNSGWLQGLVDLDAGGFALGAAPATSRGGVFAAGEVADASYKQAVTAAGDGAKAAIDAERWLRANRPPPSRYVVAAAAAAADAPPRAPPDCDLRKTACLEAVVAAHPIVVFSKPSCPFCRKALEALRRDGAKRPYVVDLAAMGPTGADVQRSLSVLTGRRTVPNVFIGGTSVGGGDETVALRRAGKLRPLLAAARASYEVRGSY